MGVSLLAEGTCWVQRPLCRKSRSHILRVLTHWYIARNHKKWLNRIPIDPNGVLSCRPRPS